MLMFPLYDGLTCVTDDQGATGIVEMLFCTSLVALVGSAESQASNSPRKLQIVNTKVGLIRPRRLVPIA